MKSCRFVTLVLVTLCSPALAVDVLWIPDHLRPAAWTINPTHPGPTDVISFSGPTDLTYGNNCSGEAALGGTPGLAIDTVNRVVELVFTGPPPEATRGHTKPVSMSPRTRSYEPPTVSSALA